MLFVLWRAITADRTSTAQFDDLIAPAWRTLLLATLVSCSAMVLGTLLAWLLMRTDLAGRSWWRVVLILPVVLPSFVGATAFLAGLSPDGFLTSALEFVGLDPPQRFRGLGPAWMLLTAFSYPFVLMPVSARLATLRPSLDESARLLGASPWDSFIRITVPHVRAAVIGGGLIVFLYVVSDFGAVQLLGYDTLTRVIFATRQADRATSFTAAALVLALAATALLLSRTVVGDIEPDTVQTIRVAKRHHLGLGQIPALLGCGLVTGISVVAPLSSLLVWAGRGLRDGRIDIGDLLTPTGNSAIMGLGAAVVTLGIVAPVAARTVRRGDAVSRLAGLAIVGGFALPGIVIALALAVLTLNTPAINALYQTIPVLALAYVIHFGSLAFGSSQDAARAVSAVLRDSARLLERSAVRRLLHIDLPVMRTGLMSGGGLVMLAVLKELPATLLLSPIGFRTLATEVWSAFEEGFYADAAAASLMLVTVSGVLTWFLVLRRVVAQSA